MRQQKNIIKISLTIGVVLMLVKFSAYLLTSSNAILTDAMESIVNVVASGFAYYSIHLAAKPRDDNHPYGHGKVEFFSVFLEGGLILIAGLLILGKAFYSLLFPEQIERLFEGMLLLGATGVVNWAYGSYMVRQSKKLNSLTIEADGRHLQTDAYSTLGLLLGLLLMYLTGWSWIDIALSVGLGLYILYHGYRLLRRSIAGLMDESDAELVEEIVGVLQANRLPDWIDVHNLRVQRYGQQLHIDCHVTMPYYYNLEKVHDKVSDIDQVVNEQLQAETELFIHVDPCLPACCYYCGIANCPVRSFPFERLIEWDSENVVRNQKHFS